MFNLSLGTHYFVRAANNFANWLKIERAEKSNELVKKIISTARFVTSFKGNNLSFPCSGYSRIAKQSVAALRAPSQSQE